MPVSGAKPRDLYLATSLAELNSHVDPTDKISTTSLPHASLIKVFDSANKAFRADKDEELAYVLYMRFVSLQKYLKPEQKQGVVAQMSMALDQATKLSNRLKVRYDLAKEIKMADAKVKELEIRDATENMSKRGAGEVKGVQRPNGLVSPAPTDDFVVTPEELKTLIDKKSTPFLLIDTRSPADFSSSHPKHPHSICISNVVLVKGISANTLTLTLAQTSPESVDLWKRRATFDLIVLYDWNSRFEQRDPVSPISVLYDVMTLWDPNTKYKGKIKILQGGYRQFYRTYPTYFTDLCPMNGQYEEAKEQYQVSLAGIAYPSLDDAPPPPPPVAIEQPPPLQSISVVPSQVEVEDRDPSPVPTPSAINTESLPKVVLNPTVNRSTKPTSLTDTVPKLVAIAQVHETVKAKSRHSTVEEPVEKPQVNGFTSPAKEIRMEKLKPEPDQWSNSSLKRSQSNPNLANILVDEPPSFNRTQKPQTRRDFSTVSSTLRHHRTGLKNLGNSCYMNSIIQCLSHTRDLAVFLSDYQNKGLVGEVTKEVGMTIQQLNRGNRCFAPEELKRLIGKHNSSFSGYTQHDSHELLTFLLDWMHEELNKASGRRNKLKEQKNENAPIELAYDTFRIDYLSVNNSLISQLFAGDQTSTIKCLKCHKESVTFEPFYFLSIPIPAGTTSKYTLDQCLDLYTTTERLEIDCTHCKSKNEMIKFIQLWRMPRYLLIHLQRFYNNGERNGNYRKKINEVRFPLEDLNLATRVKGPTTTTSNRYDLYAVSNHYGSMENGHYTAFCRNPDNWTKFDDSDTSLISGREVCTTAAYILFYQARDDE